MTVSFLVEIGSRSADIFSRSKPHEKRALLNFVLSNRELDGEKVLYKAKFPFNMVLKYAPSSNWLPLLDSLQNGYKKNLLNITGAETSLFNKKFIGILNNQSIFCFS
jgi:hypothetical protein